MLQMQYDDASWYRHSDRAWGMHWYRLASQGEAPLPEKLSALRTEGWASYDVTRRVRAVIGITATIPKDFSGTFSVDGHTVRVFRNGETPLKSLKPGHSRRYRHRVFFKMEDGQLIPVGRIAQHFGGGSGKR